MIIAKQEPSQDRLRELFDYHEDGFLVWKVDRGAKKTKGLIAGTVDVYGYRVILINGKIYKAHRLIWVWHNGHIIGTMQIDHKNTCDGQEKDNRIENLRMATRLENSRNRKTRRDNGLGLRGVIRRRYGYQAQIKICEKRKSRYFGEKFAAFDWYLGEAEQNYGEFFQFPKLSTENRHGYMDWLISESDKQKAV